MANLKPYTYHRGRGNRRFGAYLLSADYVESKAVLSRKIVREKRVLAADNGNVDLIGRLIRRQKSEADILDKRRQVEEKRLDGYARPGQLSAELTHEFQDFARKTMVASAEAINEDYVRTAVARQMSMRPSYIIGMEDFTIVTLTALNVEPEYSGLADEFYDSLNARAVDFAVRTKQGAYGPCPAQVFAGLHAIDYDSARRAGRIAGASDVDGLASGLVGALRDRNYVDFRVQEGRLIELSQAVPRPYLRVLEVAAGLHIGFSETRGHRPRFHALGAGTPILLPLLALLGTSETYTASDSTAPIVDGWTSPTISLYVDRPAPLKYKAYRIAEYWLQDGFAWDCPCPYCRSFNAAHPPAIERARSWWRSQGSPRLTRSSVYQESPLSRWLPLLSYSPDPEVRKQGALARVGHNHWVLQRIETALCDNSTEIGRLRDHVAAIMEAYATSAAGRAWKAAANAAWEIADEAAADMQEVAVGHGAA